MWREYLSPLPRGTAMSTARYIVGDVFDVLASLEPGSVDLVMTSPPFLALRSYLPADHPDKGKEIGSESTPGEFIDTMLDVVEACARVLAPHGSMVIELGDTYAGSGGAGGDYNEDGFREGQAQWSGSAAKRRALGVGDDYRPSRAGRSTGWPLDKSKVLIPQLFAIALSYGFNPLTGRQTEPWRVRNTVAWCRPNPPVGRDGDKFRPATSFLTVACKARDRYWDRDAVRTAGSANTHARLAQGIESRPTTGKKAENPNNNHGSMLEIETAGAPLLDWWEIPTHGYPGAHYATYPPKLVIPVIEAMAPRRVCRVCGKPSTRITSQPEYVKPDGTSARAGGWASGNGERNGKGGDCSDSGTVRQSETLGWTVCGCTCGECLALGRPSNCTHRWRPGLVLDPFAGSGTTLQVAAGHGRDAIGIDLDARNAELAVERIGGLFLTVETYEKSAA